MVLLLWLTGELCLEICVWRIVGRLIVCLGNCVDGELCVWIIVFMGNFVFGKLWVDELCACSIVCM